MTAAPTTASALLAELTSVSDGFSGSGLGVDVSGLADQESPLSALSAAGFDNVRQLVSFLDQPLRQLVGDPSLVSSTAQDLQAADEKLSSLADSYRTSLTNQTTAWSGTAADSYRGSGSQYADGIAALGQATSALSSAVSAGGAAVAQTAQGVRQDISTAVDQMLPILKQAQAQAAATHGASMAEAIPQCVRIATACGQSIAARLRALLASAENLKTAVDRTATAVDKVQQSFQPTTSGKPGPDTAAQTGNQPSTPQSTANSADIAANPSTQTSVAAASPSDVADSSFDPSTEDTTSGMTGGAAVATDGSNNSTVPSGASVASTPMNTTTPSLYSGGSSVGPLSARLSGLGSDSVTSTRPRPTSSVGLPSTDEGDPADGTGTAQTAARPTAGERAVGGTGLTGAGARRQEDKEHRRSLPVLPEDSAGVFDPDAPAVPAVIDAPLDPDQDGSNEIVTPLRHRRTPSPAPPPVVAPPPAEQAVQATQPVGEDDSAQQVKMVWRLSESGKLELVPQEPAPAADPTE